jgi:hypothetical protein
VKFVVTVFVLSSAIGVGCGNDHPSAIHIRGQVAPSYFSLAAYSSPGTQRAVGDAAVTHVVAVPHHYGFAYPSYELPLIQELPVSDGDAGFDFELSVDRDWVLFLVAKDAPLEQQIQGYVSLPVGDDGLFALPVTQATGDIDTGEVNAAEGGYAESSVALSDGSFSLSLADLESMARTDGVFRNLSNDYINWNPQTQESLTSTISFELRASMLALGTTPRPDALAYQGAYLYLTSTAAALVDNFDALCDLSEPLALYPPGPVLTNKGVTYDTWFPLSLYYAERDGNSCSNLHMGITDNGDNVFFGAGLFTNVVQGYWQLSGPDGYQAAFDLGVATPIGDDGVVDVPIPVPVPSEGAGGLQMAISWQVWNPAGQRFDPIDPAVVARMAAAAGLTLSAADDTVERVSLMTVDHTMITEVTSFDNAWTTTPGQGLTVWDLSVNYEMAGANYSFHWTGEPFCHDGAANQQAEACDTDDLAGQTCTSLGLGGGELACNESCGFDTTECSLGFTGSWTATGPMTEPRERHAAVRLPSGKVLVLGGLALSPSSHTLATAELYDPDTNAFTATGSMSEGRFSPEVALLADGTVLVTGGKGDSDELASAEIYDPATGEFHATATPMAVARMRHMLVPRDDGRWLVIGGFGATGLYLDSIEVYDPVTETFELSPDPFPEKIQGAAAVQLADGRTLITGGMTYGNTLNNGKSSVGYFYSGGALEFARTPGTMVEPRTYHEMALLPDGRVLIAGNANTSVPAPVEIFDPFAGFFSPLPGMPRWHDTPTLSVLPNGAVLVTGSTKNSTNGQYSGYSSIFFPKADSWKAYSETMVVGRAKQVATTLADGRILVTGGETSSGVATATAEVFRIIAP